MEYGVLGFAILLEIALIIGTITGMWKTFEKAGHPGWTCIVPIYNAVILLKISEKPMWWLLFCFIPLINIFIFIAIGISIARQFNKSTGFGLGLTLFPYVFYPILGFGDSVYKSGQ